MRPGVVICGKNVGDISGHELCAHIKHNLQMPETICIMVDDGQEARQHGPSGDTGVDEYLDMVSLPDALLEKVRSHTCKRGLSDDRIEENTRLALANELLERNLKELVAILTKIVELQVPGAGDRARKARAAAEFVGEGIGLNADERRKILFAASLHEIGKIGLPERINKINLRSMLPNEREVYNQYPIIGSMIVSNVSGFRDAANDIHHQLENFDGSGCPDGLAGDELTPGARILRTIVFHEELVLSGMPTAEIVTEMKLSSNRLLDPRIVSGMVEFLAETDSRSSRGKVKVAIEALGPGMVLAEDLFSASGVKLLPQGTKLHDKLLQLILDRNDKDPILGGVYVQR